MESTCRYRMVSLVERMLALHKQLPESLARLTKRPPCKRPDRGHGRADRRGARLYGLTEEEIGIVQKASG
jgi:hypothetical protein